MTEPGAALDDLVDEALLAAEARRRGLGDDAAVRAAVDAERRRLSVEALVEEELARLPPTPEAELKSAFHATGDSVRLILVKLASEADARAALARVKGGGDLAREAAGSADTTLAARGGDTGPVIRGALEPALQEAAFAAPLGQPFGPVTLKLGWAIGAVKERTVADEKGFEAQRPRLVAQARAQRREFVRKHLVERLTATGVTVDEAWLKALDPTRPPTAADLAHVVARAGARTVTYQAIWPSLRDLAAVGRGHMAGPATRRSLVQRELEKVVLEEAARERGLDRSPAVAATLPAIERNLLASELAVRLTGKRDAGLLDPAVQDQLARLRSKASITIDRAALRALSP
jgi:peptidyl-prolyl cis-trans isomerase C